MNDISYTLVIFEIIPLEKLRLESVDNPVIVISNVLQKNGFSLIEQKNNGEIIFGIQDKICLEQLAKKSFAHWEDELIWLAIEFFEYLIIIPTKHDVLFGFASSNDPQQLSPQGRPPSYIVSEVGDYTYRPAIPRILIATALAEQGFTELSKNINCNSSYPRETALAGDIIFVEPPIKFDLKLIDSDTGFEWRSLSLLSSRLLNQGIVDILQDETKLEQVEIAKVFPFQLFSVAVIKEEQKPFTLLNHFSIRARKGCCKIVIDELLGVSLHLNWSFAKEHTDKLSKQESIKYALVQNARLKWVEDKEQRLLYSLNILQKRYPSYSQIIEWEVNNVYSNLIRFSPVYLSWRIHLQAFIQGEKQLEPSFAALISQLDWGLLAKSGIANTDEGERIIELLKIDPTSTLTKMRVIIEKIVSLIFRREYPNQNQKITLDEKIKKLNYLNVFPPFINIYLGTVRLTGNIGAHQGVGTKEDIEAVLPIFLRIVEWFLEKELEKV